MTGRRGSTRTLTLKNGHTLVVTGRRYDPPPDLNDENSQKAVRVWIQASLENLEATMEKGRKTRPAGAGLNTLA